MNIKTFIRSLRAPFFTGVISPVLLGAAIAWNHQGYFMWGYFWLTLCAAILFHAGANTANDYFDHLSGADVINKDFVPPFTGGSRVIQEGVVTPRQMLTIAVVTYILGSAIGIYLAVSRGWFILILGLIGLISGYFYTAPPFRWAHRGIGEVFIGLNFGVLCVLGSYYVQTQRFSWEALLASLPLALLITEVLIINEIPDLHADKAVGKNHLVVRLGKRKSAILYTILLLSTYLIILALVLIRLFPLMTLITFITAPLALKIALNALKHYDVSARLKPSNAGTILTHLSMGLLLSLGFLLDKII